VKEIPETFTVTASLSPDPTTVDFTDGDGFFQHGHSLLPVQGQVGRPSRHNQLVRVVHHRLTVAGLQEELILKT
jgi:hypothetical protein